MKEWPLSISPRRLYARLGTVVTPALIDVRRQDGFCRRQQRGSQWPVKEQEYRNHGVFPEIGGSDSAGALVDDRDRILPSVLFCWLRRKAGPPDDYDRRSRCGLVPGRLPD